MSQDVIRGASGTLYQRPPVAAEPKRLVLTEVAAFGELSDREQLIATTAGREAYRAGWSARQEELRSVLEKGYQQLMKADREAKAFLTQMRDRQSNQRVNEDQTRALPVAPQSSQTNVTELAEAIAKLMPDIKIDIPPNNITLHIDKDLLQKADATSLEYDEDDVEVTQDGDKYRVRVKR